MRNPFKKENTWNEKKENTRNEEEDTTAQHTHRKKKKKKNLPQRCRLVQGCAKIMNAGESGTTGE